MSETATQPAAKQPAFFTFEGERFDVPPLAVDIEQIVAEIQTHLLASRKDPWAVLTEAAKVLPADSPALRLVAAEAYADARRGVPVVTPMEALAWLDAPAGLAWFIWRVLKDKYPKLTLETAEKMVQALGVKAAKEIRGAV